MHASLHLIIMSLISFSGVQNECEVKRGNSTLKNRKTFVNTAPNSKNRDHGSVYACIHMHKCLHAQQF